MRINLKGLKPVRRKLATGEAKTYWYHRATGERLKHDPATPDGLLEISRLNVRAQKVAETASATGSFAKLWQSYRDSPEWRALKPRTRSDYQKVRDYLGNAADTLPVKAIATEDLYKLRDKAARQRGRRFANYVVQVMRLVLEWGRKRAWLGKEGVNPARDVDLIRKPRGEAKVNRAWAPEEVEAFAEAAPLQVLVPFALGLFAGMRQGDALMVTWSAYDGLTLKWTAGKNGEDCQAPVTGAFKEILDSAKARRGNAVQIAVTTTGTPWTGTGYRASFFKLVRKLTAEGRLKPGATFHGLRHTVVTHARQDGASDFRAAAAIGDRSTAMAELYGRDADRLAAQMGALGAVQKRFANIKVENGSGKRP